MKNWNQGWAVDSLETGQYFIDESKKLGFTNQEFVTITDKVIKTSKIMYWASFPAYFVDIYGIIFKNRTRYNKGNVKAAKYQYICMKKNLWDYSYFKAIKNK